MIEKISQKMGRNDFNRRKSEGLLWGTALILAFSMIFASCAKKSGADKAEEEKAETVFAVNVYKAVPRTLDDYLEFGGNVQTASSVDIYPDVQSGKLSKILVKVGQKVEKDQVLKLTQAAPEWTIK